MLDILLKDFLTLLVWIIEGLILALAVWCFCTDPILRSWYGRRHGK